MVNSAFVGEPPATDDDFYIVRGILRTYGLNNLNASAGLAFSIQRPENPPNESKKPAILAGVILVILAIVVPTVARVIIRLKGARTQFGADDLAIIAAASLAVSYPCIVIAMLAQTGAGRHTYESTYEEYNLYFYYLSVCRIIFYVSVGLIKVSITLFVRRLADRASKKWRLFADIFLGTVVIYILLAIFWFVFTCNPIQFAWDKKFGGSLDKPPVCIDTGLQNKFLSSMHVAQSIVLLLAPIIILWYVKINTAKKSPSLLHLACRRHNSPWRTSSTNNGHYYQRFVLAIHIRHALDGPGPDIRHTYRLTPCFGCSDNGDVELHQD
ncbi:hypothetical protein H9Q72_003398 [Fusarium xylarioides]|uniref:Rhodopsin domain-containing protein n=1 Tax=Fusarium xylarioides TaxID=221167 RepID=A0A9P7HZU4_9HYPO|nr:hypothetical protein H9Q70_008641 [Fusarium xylarioides]KAG5769304.1 hypothetical protein H9Q72_003398 [Fusarium xylarioides]